MGVYLMAATMALAAGESTSQPATPALQLNIDFYDLVITACPDPARADFLGCVDGVYPERKLERLIRRAADSGFGRVHFRISVCGLAAMHATVKERADNDPRMIATLAAYDPFAVAIRTAHDAGIECYAWLTPLDDGPADDWPQTKAPLQSRFSFEHPEYQLVSRQQDDPICGLYCFGYPQVIRYHLAHLDEVLAYKPDGVFYSCRTHSNMNGKRKEYGFNQPVIEAYQQRYGHDPREANHYDLQKFSDVQGSFYTAFLTQAADRIHAAGGRVSAAAAWSHDGRISPRLGALDKCFFQWQRWANEGIVDELVIGGDAATSHDPEHLLASYDVSAPSVRPAYYREQTIRPVTITRWLTLWSWYWPGKDQITGPPCSTYTADVVAKMVSATAASGVDGIQIHEALNIAMHDQWDVFRQFRK